MTLKKSFTTAVALVAITLVLATAAKADSLSINIYTPGTGGFYDNGGTGRTFTDNGANDLLSSDLNALLIGTSVGAMSITAIPGFSLNINTALSNAPGGPANSFLDLNWVLQSSTGGTLVITASATNYTFPGAGVPTTLLSQLNGNIASGTGTITGQQWANLDNSLFGTTGFTTGPQGLNTSLTVPFTSDGQYSITDRLTFNLGANTTTTGDFASTASVPEPASLLLLGTGLFGVGLTVRRRKSKQ